MSGSTSNIQGTPENRRIMVLLTPRTYRAQPFFEAAARLGLEFIKAIDMNRQLADYWDFELGFEFADTKTSVSKIVQYAAAYPLAAVIAVDDSGTVLAAEASRALGLAHNLPQAAEASRDKHRMRQLLAEAKVQSPEFRLFHFERSLKPGYLASLACQVGFPCVVKPLNLNGSRGVIRADNEQEFVEAAIRLQRLLVRLDPFAESIPFLVEQYVAGNEVALEGILDKGELHVLAIFDKPDPLEGPFFEETIYVTPSRLPGDVQSAILTTTRQAAAAIGLREGPVHAELRLNNKGTWMIELAGRSIGGRCSNALRFGTGTSLDKTLEELILRQATGMEFAQYVRESGSSGVMMIPIPEAGLLKQVNGCEAAEELPLIDKVEIAVPPNQHLRPLPEGDSYLGFIFASGPTPAAVEEALRQAHSCLKIEVAPEIALVSAGMNR